MVFEIAEAFVLMCLHDFSLCFKQSVMKMSVNLKCWLKQLYIFNSTYLDIETQDWKSKYVKKLVSFRLIRGNIWE